jgi:hypothetical protein
MAHRFPLSLLLSLLLLSSGCPTGFDDDDDTTGDDDDSAGVDAQTHAVVTTTDFAVGALATVDLDTWEVTDSITATSADPFVRTDDGLVLQINRWQHDSVRIYDPADLTTPLVELSTGAGSNPQEALFCGGDLFVTRLEETSIGVYDPDTGMAVGTVDLSTWTDDDGSPEATTMARIGDTLYVGLQRLDRASVWWTPSDGGGRVLEVDCASREVTREWSTGSNVIVQQHPVVDDTLLLVDGAYYTDEGLVSLDGGIRELPLDGEPGSYRLTDEDLGGNVLGVAATAEGRGIVITAEDVGHRVLCLDMADWSTTELLFTEAYIPEFAVNDRGEAWIVVRSWLDPEDEGGLLVIDLDTCTDLTEDSWIRFELEPFSVAFF